MKLVSLQKAANIQLPERSNPIRMTPLRMELAGQLLTQNRPSKSLGLRAMTSKVKRVTYLYCDFCNKRMNRVDAMNHHEERCTLNPNRKCGMCKDQRDYDKLATIFSSWHKKNGRLDALQMLDSNVHCPACMLTVLRLCSVAKEYTDIFQLKEKMDRWNEEQENVDPRFV
jgi:hypothetical protein